MINFGIKIEKILDYLREDVKMAKTIENGKKKYQSFYNENGEITLRYIYDKDESLRIKQVSTFQSGIKTGYINYDKYDNRQSVGQFEYDASGNMVARYHDGKLEEWYELNEKGLIVTVNFPTTHSKDTYEYDENNMAIRQVSIQGANSLFSGMPGAIKNKLTTFRNDRFGNIVEMKIFNYDTKEQLFSKLNKFNEKGDEIESRGLYPNGTIYSITRNEYEYDKKNNWINRRQFDKDGNLMNYVNREINYFAE